MCYPNSIKSLKGGKVNDKRSRQKKRRKHFGQCSLLNMYLKNFTIKLYQTIVKIETKY